MITSQFPQSRLRRLRQAGWVRDLVRETQLSPADLIWPCFIITGENQIEPVKAMPCVNRYSIDKLIDEAKRVHDLGIQLIALFPATPKDLKDDQGKEALNENNLINSAVRAIKKACPDLGVMTDVALDPYTTHGHDGIIIDDSIANDETVDILVQQALVQARSGADVIAPSDMQDGRVGAIRTALEAEGFKDTLIMAYSAKYASKFYGPFREAVGSQAQLGKKGKETYQMDPANSDEAVRETALDIHEGADMVMVKPGMPYLDIVYRIKQELKMPTFVYQVSGEYSMLKHAVSAGLMDEKVILESLLAFKRAGADGILSYFSSEIASIIK